MSISTGFFLTLLTVSGCGVGGIVLKNKDHCLLIPSMSQLPDLRPQAGGFLGLLNDSRQRAAQSSQTWHCQHFWLGSFLVVKAVLRIVDCLAASLHAMSFDARSIHPPTPSSFVKSKMPPSALGCAQWRTAAWASPRCPRLR